MALTSPLTSFKCHAPPHALRPKTAGNALYIHIPAERENTREIVFDGVWHANFEIDACVASRKLCRANTYFDPIPDAVIENLDQITAVTLFVAHNFDAVPFETLYSNVAQDIFDKDLPAGHKGIIPAEILGP